MLYAGIDAGSRTVKVVFLNARGKAILAQGLVDQGVHQEALARHLFDRLLREKKLDQSRIRKVVATGYGRNQIGFAHATVTEITCQAAGVRFRRPRARTIVDIGGQDSKFIQLDADGSVRDFAMNDRCAAGTGRFLEVTAGRLGMDLSALGEVAQTSRDPARISSMGVVFA